jgi:hypothetical protein
VAGVVHQNGQQQAFEMPAQEVRVHEDDYT